jgi:hypothetical protein
MGAESKQGAAKAAFERLRRIASRVPHPEATAQGRAGVIPTPFCDISHRQSDPRGAIYLPAGENLVCGCNADDSAAYYVSRTHEHNGKIGGTMTQKIFERVKQATQNASYDHVRLDLPDEAICDILETVEDNKTALRFLARR